VIRVGALLHDIGKIGVTDSVLRKPSKLTSGEMAQVQQHPSIDRRILEGVRGFQQYLPIVELHRENWDGTGYPLHLSDVKVPLCARITHVADAHDAMTSARTQFDPDVVKALLRADEVGKFARNARSNVPNPRLISLPRATGEAS